MRRKIDLLYQALARRLISTSHTSTMPSLDGVVCILDICLLFLLEKSQRSSKGALSRRGDGAVVVLRIAAVHTRLVLCRVVAVSSCSSHHSSRGSWWFREARGSSETLLLSHEDKQRGSHARQMAVVVMLRSRRCV